MTKERISVLLLLGDARNGLRCADMAETLSSSRRNLVSVLGEMKELGLVCKVGVSGPMVLWCLPDQTSATCGKYHNSGTIAQKRARIKARESRLSKVVQRVVPASSRRGFDIPAVNSVWALSA